MRYVKYRLSRECRNIYPNCCRAFASSCPSIDPLRSASKWRKTLVYVIGNVSRSRGRTGRTLASPVQYIICIISNLDDERTYFDVLPKTGELEKNLSKPVVEGERETYLIEPNCTAAIGVLGRNAEKLERNQSTKGKPTNIVMSSLTVSRSNAIGPLQQPADAKYARIYSRVQSPLIRAC